MRWVRDNMELRKMSDRGFPKPFICETRTLWTLISRSWMVVLLTSF